MPSFINDIMDFASSPTFSTVQIVALSYFGLLWLSIIIWVTRDSIHRSSSLIFQTFAILINIAVPILGVLLYLIIRPSHTNLERYYEELEHKVLAEGGEERSITCSQCMTLVDRDYTYCPNCSTKVKKACKKCKKSYPSIYNICPYCGNEDEKEDEEPKKITKKRITKK
ncbi:zinc ribbon domain-containing protein [Patescibacteria group bacterium]|nr:zinc ribbon domain-containing protein [Patescibacteria group bacterium]